MSVCGQEAQHDPIMCPESQILGCTKRSITSRSTLAWSETVWAGVRAMSLGMKNEYGNGEEGNTWEVRCNMKKLAPKVVKPVLRKNIEMSRK